MAKITGPLMSLSASGTIADTLTFSSWKGIPYARTRVIPANPQSAEQTNTREVFRWLFSLYKFMPTIAREPWLAAAVGVALTPINMLLSKNIAPMRLAIDLGDFVASPGNAGGIPPAAAVVTPGSGSLSVAVTAPTAPAGWTITAAQGIALLDQDPHDVLAASPVAVEDLTSPYTLAFTGLTHGDLYQLGIWLKWLTPGGIAAYSTAINTSGTTT